jgi:excisionase family DNA binding protein
MNASPISATGGAVRNRATFPGAPRSADPTWHLLSIKEVAAACQLSEKAVRRAIDDGELPAVKLRSRLRITPQDFESWIAASRRGAALPTPPPRRRAARRAPAGTFRSLVQSEVEL